MGPGSARKLIRSAGGAHSERVALGRVVSVHLLGPSKAPSGTLGVIITRIHLSDREVSEAMGASKCLPSKALTKTFGLR